MRIVIDFDGTIVDSDFPKIHGLKPFAKDIINKWHSNGNSIIINTCRTGKFEGDAEEFLKINNIAFDYINCNLPDDIKHFKQDCRKISGDVYIDDKQLGGLPDWLIIDKLVRDHPLYPKNTQLNLNL